MNVGMNEVSVTMKFKYGSDVEILPAGDLCTRCIEEIRDALAQVLLEKGLIEELPYIPRVQQNFVRYRAGEQLKDPENKG